MISEAVLIFVQPKEMSGIKLGKNVYMMINILYEKMVVILFIQNPCITNVLLHVMIGIILQPQQNNYDTPRLRGGFYLRNPRI